MYLFLQKQFHYISNNTFGHVERLTVLQSLTELMEKRIKASQNPENCTLANKLVYSIGVSGYGSEMELISRALLEAFYIGRVLILKSKGWSYCKKGWEEYHLPLSNTCREIQENDQYRYYYKDMNDTDKQVLHLGDNYINRPKALIGVPQDIAPLLAMVHSHPEAWWMAQFTKHVSRLQPWVQSVINTKKMELRSRGFVRPVVGLHIRRTDKISRHESEYIDTHEYLKQAEKYFKLKEIQNKLTYSRVIYLATDDADLVKSIQIMYPEYKFLVLTSQPSRIIRKYPYVQEDLLEIIMDLAFLVEADFTVCTFSSNICRRVYEFKQTMNHNDPTSVYSLDMQYITLPEYRIALAAQNDTYGNDTLAFIKGDLIKVCAYYKLRPQGLGYGICIRTGKGGLYPTNKTTRYIKIAQFPNYGYFTLKLYNTFLKNKYIKK